MKINLIATAIFYSIRSLNRVKMPLFIKNMTIQFINFCIVTIIIKEEKKKKRRT